MDIEKTKEYKNYVNELSRFYLMIDEKQKKQYDIVMKKERELNKILIKK